MATNAQFMMSSSSLVVRTSNGSEICVASLIYNASISALEVRAYRPEGQAPALLDALAVPPMRIYENVDGTTECLRAVVNFETATLGFAFECDPGGVDREGHQKRDGVCVKEVVILRGLHIENVQE